MEKEGEMKAARRYGYWLLSTLERDLPINATTCLCTWCKHAVWVGHSCCDADLECHQGIEKVEERAFDVWQGDDCWGFRPDVSREDAVDICGLYLQGKRADWQALAPARKEKGMSGYWIPGIDSQTGDMSMDMDLATWHEREPEPPYPEPEPPYPEPTQQDYEKAASEQGQDPTPTEATQ